MSLEQITSRQGLLSTTVPLFDRSTIQHSDEIQKDRFDEIKKAKGNVAQTELPNQWFWTADLPLYAMEGKEAVLYMGRGKDNFVFDNIVDATTQLRKEGNYFINDRKNIDAVINSDTTLKVVLSDLRLKGNDSEWRYFEIDTKKYDKLNASERALAERVHGKGQAFKDSMEMLSSVGKEITRVYVLNPEYVKKTVPQNGAIARVFALVSFDLDSYAVADGRFVDYSSGRLRGVPLASEAGAQKIITPQTYFIDQVLAEANVTADFAPTQIRILKNVLENPANNYRIIKGDSQ